MLAAATAVIPFAALILSACVSQNASDEQMLQQARAIGTFPEGTVRVSFGQFNTREDVDALLAAVRQIRNIHAADRSVRA